MMKVTHWRRASWFATAAFFLAFWMGVLGSLPHDAQGGVIPSHGNEPASGKYRDLRRLERFLETKLARQKLEDFGVPPGEALAKLREMSDQDLHVLASMADRIPEGADAGFFGGELVFVKVMLILAVVGLVILVILGAIGIGVLAKYLKNKKPETRQADPAPEPTAEPAK